MENRREKDALFMDVLFLSCWFLIIYVDSVLFFNVRDFWTACCRMSLVLLVLGRDDGTISQNCYGFWGIWRGITGCFEYGEPLLPGITCVLIFPWYSVGKTANTLISGKKCSLNRLQVVLRAGVAFDWHSKLHHLPQHLFRGKKAGRSRHGILNKKCYKLMAA
jgi:hypothetical protein